MKQYLRLLSYLYPYRLRLAAAFACALLVAGLEGKRPFFDLTEAEAAEVREVFRRTIVDGLSRRLTTRVPTRA